MNELGSIDGTEASASIGRVKSKTIASVETPASMEGAQSALELQELEIQMEQVEHAFALMKEISFKIERAYKELGD